MSSMIVLCPHCLTWIEIHAECCTECAGGVSIEDPDPTADELDARLGEWLLDLGDLKLLRQGWPDMGRLIATTEGLLFVPHFGLLPNGALTATTEGTLARPERIRSLLHWWSLPAWRRPVEVQPSLVVLPIRAQPLRTLLIDAPGAFFIERETIRRVTPRWGRIQIERSVARTVSLAPISGTASLRESLRRLMDFAPWRGVVAGL